jgi:Rps23 Pro-64 3,4-dihydroxylase Tpa1-like proline 4-hydroxylase
MIFLPQQDPVEFLIIEDFFTDLEQQAIWKELDFLTDPNKLLPPDQTDGARSNGSQEIRKNNSGLFLDYTYSNKNVSYILTFNQKILNEDVISAATACSPFYGILNYINNSTTLVSYYEDGGYYLPHTDRCPITVLYYFFKEPKKFTGGNLKILGREIEIKNNMAVMFFGCFEHEVDKISYSGKPYSGDGRYCISQFLSVIA